MLNKELITRNIPPLFISFEGGEGCGKTTQLRLLEDILKKNNVDVVFTREPGGTPEGETIRNLLVTGDVNKWSTVEELMLLSTGRSKHVRDIITPALENGKLIISDRFADSSTVYQGYVQGLDMEIINTLNNIAVRGNWPDLTIILDIPVEIGLARKGKQADDGLNETRYESHGDVFHKKVRDGYLELAKQNPERMVVISATGDINTVHERIISAINDAIAKKVDKLAS